MAPSVTLPEELRVLKDGTWTTGGAPVAHDRSLFYFKLHLVFENGEGFVVDGQRRLPVAIEGPPFIALRLLVDPKRGEVRATLDDGTEEALAYDAFSMDPETGRFECTARSGQARALLSRGAHQTLLEHAEQEGGQFFLRAGLRRYPIRM